MNMQRHKLGMITGLFAALLIAAPAVSAAGYEIDTRGSSITFVAGSRLGDVEGCRHLPQATNFALQRERRRRGAGCSRRLQ